MLLVESSRLIVTYKSKVSFYFISNENDFKVKTDFS